MSGSRARNGSSYPSTHPDPHPVRSTAFLCFGAPGRGESIKVLSEYEYLGHHDPGFTLRTYTQLMPSSETRTRARRGCSLGRPGCR